MPSRTEVVITGVGVVCPIGTGKEAYWSALAGGRTGIGPLRAFDPSGLPVQISAEIAEFDPKLYVRPRKSLKVMSRDSQLGMAAADLCWHDAQGDRDAFDPERFGVVFGADPIRTTIPECLPAYLGAPANGRFGVKDWAMGATRCFPLVMLQNLPNMVPAHISIALDARGPNNTLYQGDVSGLLALGEAARIIERGAADAVLAGGASSRMHPFDWARFCLYEQLSHCDDPNTACRPFDAGRDGSVRGEGAAAFLLESRAHAEQRGARIQARVLGFAVTGDPISSGRPPSPGTVCRAMLRALDDAELPSREVGHVNADGLSTVADDRIEAQAIRDIFGDTPVTAPKSYFGNLGAASGAVELVASLLALQLNVVPATLNYSQPDPACPINVVHGASLEGRAPVAIKVNRTTAGQTVALILAGPHEDCG